MDSSSTPGAPEKVEFRRVSQSERDDLWQMLQVHMGELSQYNPHMRPHRGVFPYASFELYWKHPSQRHAYFILLNGERVGLLFLSEGVWPWYGYSDVCVEVSEVYVAPEFRGRGIGRRAMEFALQWAHKRGRPLLWSSYCNNARALRLYYRFAAACRESGLWRLTINSTVDGFGCDRKNFRIEPVPTPPRSPSR